MSIRLVAVLAFAVLLALSNGPAGAVTLTGVIRDFCAPSIAGTCTQLSDFEGAITGVVQNMVDPTLTGGLPTPGPTSRPALPLTRTLPSGSSTRPAST